MSVLTPGFMMRQHCTVRRWIERGINSDVYGEPETLPCRVSFGRQIYRSAANYNQGELIGKGKAYLPAGTRLRPMDILTFDGVDYQAAECQPRYGLNGVESHVEVTLGV